MLFFFIIPVYPQKKVDLPELILQTGHGQSVQAITFGPDGKWIATGSYDGTIKVWDVEEGRELRALIGHTGAVKALTISPDGQTLISSATDKTIRIWTLGLGEEKTKITTSEFADALAFSPDGSRLVWGQSDGVIISQDLRSGSEQQYKGLTVGVSALAYSPDGTQLVAGDSSGTVWLWEVVSESSAKKLTGHKDKIRIIHFDPRGQRFATAGDDLDIRIWDRTKKRQITHLKGSGAALLALRFAPGDKLYSAAADKSVNEWSLAGKSRIESTKKVAQIVTEETAESANFSADGNLLSHGYGSGIATVSDISTGQVKATLRNNVTGNYGIAVSGNNRWLAVGSFDNSVKLWDLKSGINLPSLRGHSGRVTSVKFDPNGELLYSASLDSSIKIWKVESGSLDGVLPDHAGPVGSIDISRNGRMLVSGSLDETVRLWDLKDRKLLSTLRGHVGEVVSVSFSPDDTKVASAGSDGKIRIWNANAEDLPFKTIEPNIGPLRSVVFAEDMTRLLVGGEDGIVRVWDLATNKQISSFEGHNGYLNSISLSSGSSDIITTGHDGTVRIWNEIDRKRDRVLKGHVGPVYSVSGTSDGRWLFSSSEDGSVILWNRQNNERAATLISLKEREDWLVATPSGLFDGSTSAWNQLSWRFEKSTFNVRPVEVYFSEFFSPGILSKVYSGQEMVSSAVLSDKDRRQPKIKIELNNLSNINDVRDREVKIRMTVVQAEAGAKDLRLFRNGTLVKVWRGDVLSGKTQKMIEFTVPVIAGDNKLTAYAFNVDNVKSQDAEVAFTGASALSRKGDLHIVSVGLNDYSNPAIRDLKYAVADAILFSSEFSRQQAIVGRFRDIKSHQLLNENATRIEIVNLLKKVSTGLQPEDALVFYYAGHGIAIKDRFYFIPHDFTPIGPIETLLNNFPDDQGISDKDLEAILDNVGAGTVLMVIDACNSGQALEASDARFGPINSKGLAQLAYEKGMYVLTASQNYQAALEASKLGHGFLTFSLVEEGLKTTIADTSPKDGKLVIREWLDFATKRVPNLHFEQTGSRQLVHKTPAPVKGSSQPEPSTIPKSAPQAEAQRPRVFYRRERESSPFIVSIK